jgi:hypothetical protein
MKKTLILTGVLLALTASLASAGGINLAWQECLGSGGQVNRTFACNTNAGIANDLYISFDPPVNIPDVNGSNPLIDLQSASDPLPAWWQMKNSGTCRPLSLAANTGPGSCVDTWQGQGVAGIAAYITNAVLPSEPTNRARLLGSISVPTAAAGNVDPGTEYFCLIVRINNAKSTGLGACAGCNDPVCLVLNEVLLTSNNSGDNRIVNPLVGNFATWQGGAIGGAGCPAATPTSNKTWGQLKSIYR